MYFSTAPCHEFAVLLNTAKQRNTHAKQKVNNQEWNDVGIHDDLHSV